jgi:hypothetical protein
MLALAVPVQISNAVQAVTRPGFAVMGQFSLFEAVHCQKLHAKAPGKAKAARTATAAQAKE